jgi:hypothetical protein
MDNPEVVKKPYLKTKMTLEQCHELVRCTHDYIHFIKNYVKIQHPTDGVVPFEPFPFQYRLFDSFAQNRFTIALTARQMGKTTVAAAFLLWKAMFVPNFKILIVANTYKQALEIMDRVRFAYENLPDFIRCGATEYNKGTVTFDNGSQITSRATGPNSTRGLSISMLYCDEFAFVSPRIADDFWTSARPVLATGGGCVITSTPKNDEDKFAQIWRQALDIYDDNGNPNDTGLGKNGFKAVKITWDEHPLRDEEWAKKERAAIGEQKFLQEYNCEFVSDDETLVNSIVLSQLRGREPEFYTTTVRWFKEPEPNKTYLVALDPCTGSGGDHAAIEVFEVGGKTVNQIAEWQHNLTPARGQVALLMNILKFLYSSLHDHPDQEGDPEIFWTFENNSIGDSILQVIEDTGEENFPGILLNEKKKKGQVKRNKRGLLTDNRRKLAGCNRLKSLIESARMTINSKKLLKELKNFVASGASYKAKPGEHDDLVMGTVLIARMLDLVVNYSLNNMDDLKEAINEDDEEDAGGGDDLLPVLV